jgi:hypothetical protein
MTLSMSDWIGLGCVLAVIGVPLTMFIWHLCEMAKVGRQIDKERGFK